MTDYSEIMQHLPALHRKREDALRDCDFKKAKDLTSQIMDIDDELYGWLLDKLLENKK